MKIETEGPIATAQDQVLKTNLTKIKIDKSQNNPTVCAECAKRKMKGSCTSFQDVVNWQRKSTRRDMIAWGKLSTGTSVEEIDLNTVRKVS